VPKVKYSSLLEERASLRCPYRQRGSLRQRGAPYLLEEMKLGGKRVWGERERILEGDSSLGRGRKALPSLGRQGGRGPIHCPGILHSSHI